MTSAKSLKHNIARFDLKRSFITNLPAAALMLTVGMLMFCARDYAKDFPYFDMIMNGALCEIPWAYQFAFTLFGALFALSSFSFINSKKQVNVYFSMGISRKCLFRNRVISSLVYIISSAFIISLSVFLINVRFKGFNKYFVYWSIAEFAALTAFALVGFSFSSLAMFLSGGIKDGAVLTVTILLLPSALAMLADTLISHLLGVNSIAVKHMARYFAESPDVITKAASFNPLLFSKNVNTIYLSDNFFGSALFSSEPNNAGVCAPSLREVLPFIAWIGAAAAIIALSYSMFRRRKAEIAGVSGANNKLNNFCAVSLSLFVPSLVVITLEDFPRQLFSQSAAIIIGTIGFLIFALIVNAVMTKNKRQTLRNTLAALPCALFICSVMFAMAFDIMEYKMQVPQIDEVETVYISVDAINDIDKSGYSSVQIGNVNLSTNICETVGPVRSEKDLKMLLPLIKDLATNDKDTRECCVYVHYEMKNGGVRNIRYNAANKDALKNLLQIYNGDWRDEEIEYYFGDGELSEKPFSSKEHIDRGKRANMIRYHDRIRQGDAIIFSPLSRAEADSIPVSDELLEALKKDLQEQTANQIFFPDEAPVAIIDMSEEYSEEISIYKYMKNTVAYLEENGCFEKIKNAEFPIVTAQAVSVKKYYEMFGETIKTADHGCSSAQFIASDTYIFSDDFGGKPNLDEFLNDGFTDVTDEKTLAELMKYAVPRYYQVSEDGYFIFIYYDVNGNVRFFNYYIPSGKLPPDIKL